MSMIDNRDGEGFWNAACARAMRVVAAEHPQFAEWTMTPVVPHSQRERLELEGRVNTDGFVDAATGYFDRAAKRIVVILDNNSMGDESAVREMLEGYGAVEDDPEVAAACWIVQSVESDLGRKAH